MRTGTGTFASPSRRPRLGLLTVASTLILLAAAGQALAHGGSRHDFVSEIRRVTPAVPGLEVRVLGSDSRLQLRDPGHHTVVVLGYDGEPFARLLPEGSAQVNVRSPATYLNQNRSADVEVPQEADSRAAPVWRAYTGNGRLEWHDHRAHWMGAGTPPQVSDTTARTKVFDYRVPIVVDGNRATIEGTLYWAGRPNPPPLAGAAALVIVPIMVGAAVLLWKLRGLPPGPEA
jgi:hypothetical protein